VWLSFWTCFLMFALQRAKPKEKQQDGHPTCHGCKQRMAQFVCAGCNSQWYCSRECQVRNRFVIDRTKMTCSILNHFPLFYLLRLSQISSIQPNLN
jgi:hypothetical protein